MKPRTMNSQGLAFGFSAYFIWGLFPLYWALLKPASPYEILAHRVAWSVVVLLVLLVGARRVGQFREILRSRRTIGVLAVAAVLVALNWGTYIWGVNNGRVVETALGYFINPLVSVILGVFVLGERLRRIQWFAVGLAGFAVVVLTWDYGHPPWVALILAFSFGIYGLAKKKAGVGAIEGLTFETLMVFPLAVAYLAWLAESGRLSFGQHGTAHAVLLASTGIATAIPLLLFGAAALRLPLTTIGLLQYMAPMMQFGLGLLAFHEPMTQVRWVGFLIVWVALVVFTVDAVGHHRRAAAAGVGLRLL